VALFKPVNISNLARVAHIAAMGTLRQFVPQVRQRDVRAVSLYQSIDSILPRRPHFSQRNRSMCDRAAS
jgi:hypothetical protein